ncbi:Transglutaminase-like superfamily protein [compost metagenome]
MTHITYDIALRDEQTVESILISIDKGKGVCGDYALLFMYLCRRASIPCVYEASFEMEHAWNAVFINGQWLFVDATWDDDDSDKIKYTYFLKDRFAFMSNHIPIMGVPDPKLFKNLDPMNLKSQDEVRAYLLENFYWTDGFKMSFRMADKNIKPIIPYMWDHYVTVKLTYDAKNNLYTVTAKDK